MDDALLLTRRAETSLADARARLTAPPPPAPVPIVAPLFAAALMACAGLSVLGVVLFGPNAPSAKTGGMGEGLPAVAGLR